MSGTGVMLSVAANTRIFVCSEPTDMRKSFDGLCGLVTDSLGQDPLSGALFLFANRRRDRIKLLVWDGDGYALWYKRLEKGTFKRAHGTGMIKIDSGILAIILEGLDPDQMSRPKRWSPQVS